MLRLLRSIRDFFRRLFSHKTKEEGAVLEYNPPSTPYSIGRGTLRLEDVIGTKPYSPEPSVKFKEYYGKYGSMRTGRLTALSSQFTMYKGFIAPHRPEGDEPYCEAETYGRRCSI